MKAKVVSFQSDFTTTREGIRVLNAYKAMHDVLHTLQFQCHDILAQVCKLVEVSDMSWSLVGTSREYPPAAIGSWHLVPRPPPAR